MKMTTTENVAGRLVEDTLGVVRGSVLWSRRIMKFNHGGLRGLNYTSMEEMSDGLNQAKEKAEAKAQEQCLGLGGDAIICLKLEIMELSDGLFQAVAIGTAVKTSPMPQPMPFAGIAANDDAIEPYVTAAQRPGLRLVSNLVH